MQLTVSAKGTVAFRPDKFELVSSEKLPKGPFLETARLSAFLAAKRDSFFGTKVFINHMEVNHHWGPSELTFTVRMVVDGNYDDIIRRVWFAAFTCCITCYDMVKAVDPDAIIEDVSLLSINDKTLPVKLLPQVNPACDVAFSPTVIISGGKTIHAGAVLPNQAKIYVRCLDHEQCE